MKLPLVVNALLSILMGVAGTFFTHSVCDFLGISNQSSVRLFGVMLLIHGLLLIWVSRGKDLAPWVCVNLVAIAPYPAIVLALIATGQIEHRRGIVTALIDAVAVGLLAIWQYRALSHARALTPNRR